MSNFLLSLNGTITQSRLRELVHYDPLTGLFTWLKVEISNQCKVGEVAGGLHKSKGYWHLKLDGVEYLRSRLAWFYMTGEWPPRFVDHRDRDSSNDQWANLRLATNQQNIQNSKLRGDNSSGVKGVYWAARHKKWEASIRVNKKLLYLGHFKEIEDAAAARREAELKYFGEFAPAQAA